MTTYHKVYNAENNAHRMMWDEGNSRAMTLNDVMAIDHVIEVLPNGNVSDDDIPSVIKAAIPELMDGGMEFTNVKHLDGFTEAIVWELMDGYSGQSGYSGPIMHDSEFIGGRLADDMLEQPGFYVAIMSMYSCTAECGDNDCDGAPHSEGWAVAYRPNR